MIYLDNSATTRVLPESIQAVQQAMEDGFFNPAAAYAPASKTEKQVEQARSFIASVIKAEPRELLFTSGGTESNNMAIRGSLQAIKGKPRLITTAVEHPSVFDTVAHMQRERDCELVILPVDQEGTVSLEALKEALTENTALVSIMQVNNELGSVNPIREASQCIRKKAPGALFHVDGVQGFLKCEFDSHCVDLYSLSAHKFHAPKGVGVLYKAKGIRFSGGQTGGGQEQDLRSGTLNVPGILGMEAAIRWYSRDIEAHRQRLFACKQRLYDNLMSLPDVLLNGPSLDRAAPHILNMSFMGVRGAVLLNALSAKEIYVSTGSACSSHKKGHNRILSAAGIQGDREEGAIRFSFSPFNTPEEMDTVAEHISQQLTFLRKYRRR